MFIFIACIHIIVSVALVVFVLLQSPKGGAIGMLGGQSSSKSVFGSTGASDFLINATKWCAVIFAITSIQLAYMSSKREESIILDQEISESASPPVKTPDQKSSENSKSQ